MVLYDTHTRFAPTIRLLSPNKKPTDFLALTLVEMVIHFLKHFYFVTFL